MPETASGLTGKPTSTFFALETSNKGNTFVKTDVITVTYSEAVLCSGMNQMLDTPIEPVITVRVRDVVLTWTGNDDSTNHLRYECDGAFVHISLSPGADGGEGKFAVEKAATGFYKRDIEVTITGVVDIAGNESGCSWHYCWDYA